MKAMPLIKVATVLVFLFLMGSFVAYRSGFLPNPFIGSNQVQTISGEGANTLLVGNKAGVRDTPPPNQTIMPSSKLSPVFNSGDVKSTPVFLWDTSRAFQMMISSKFGGVFRNDDFIKVHQRLTMDTTKKWTLDTSARFRIMSSSKSVSVFDTNDLKPPTDTPPKKTPEMMRGSKSAPVFTPNQSNQSTNPK